MIPNERNRKIAATLVKIGDQFASAFGGGSPDNPGDQGDDFPEDIHGIQTETGIDITTEDGLIIQAENQS